MPVAGPLAVREQVHTGAVNTSGEGFEYLVQFQEGLM